VRPVGLHAVGVDASFTFRIGFKVYLQGWEEAQPLEYPPRVVVSRDTPGYRSDQVADQAYRDLATADETLDQDGLAIAHQLVGQLGAQLQLAVYNGLAANPIPVPSRLGFTKRGNRRSESSGSSARSKTWKAGVGNPWNVSTRLVIALSSVKASVSTPLPV